MEKSIIFTTPSLFWSAQLFKACHQNIIILKSIRLTLPSEFKSPFRQITSVGGKTANTRTSLNILCPPSTDRAFARAKCVPSSKTAVLKFCCQSPISFEFVSFVISCEVTRMDMVLLGNACPLIGKMLFLLTVAGVSIVGGKKISEIVVMELAATLIVKLSVVDFRPRTSSPKIL